MVKDTDVSSSVKRFYKRLRTTDSISDLDIPHSDVYFVRWAIYERTGVYWEVEHVQVSMWLEGWLNPEDVKTIPRSYIEQFFGGTQPNMDELRAKVRVRFNKRQLEKSLYTGRSI